MIKKQTTALLENPQNSVIDKTTILNKYQITTNS